MPAKATIYNMKTEPVFDFGTGPRNFGFYNPQGTNILCISQLSPSLKNCLVVVTRLTHSKCHLPPKNYVCFGEIICFILFLDIFSLYLMSAGLEIFFKVHLSHRTSAIKSLLVLT